MEDFLGVLVGGFVILAFYARDPLRLGLRPLLTPPNDGTKNENRL